MMTQQVVADLNYLTLKMWLLILSLPDLYEMVDFNKLLLDELLPFKMCHW